MSRPVEELLIDYALGTLSGGDKDSFERELERAPELARALAETREALSGLTFGLKARRPPPSVKSRLMAEIDGSERLVPFTQKLMRFFDLGAKQVRAMLDRAMDPSQWETAPFPEIRPVLLFHLEAGPALAGADAGLVRVPAGYHFPLHHHDGEERLLFLQGTLHDLTQKRDFGPGDEIVNPKGSQHEYQVTSSEDLLHALVLFDGVSFPGGSGGRAGKH